MILLRREKPLQPVPTGKEIGGFRGNQLPGTKTHLSAEKAAEVSPLQQLLLWCEEIDEGWGDPQS